MYGFCSDLGGFAEGQAVECLKDLFHLPQVPTLMRRQHAKRAIHVVAEPRIHGRFDSHLINGKADRRLYGSVKLGLRRFERIPRGIEVVLTRNQRQ